MISIRHQRRQRDLSKSNRGWFYKYLKEELKGTFGSSIKWNFTKFLVDKSGKPIKRYAPTDEPKDLEKDIEKDIKDLLGVSCKVRLVEPKTIQRSQGKAQRVIDRRKV